jgi:hypothetical protein
LGRLVRMIGAARATAPASLAISTPALAISRQRAWSTS